MHSFYSCVAWMSLQIGDANGTPASWQSAGTSHRLDGSHRRARLQVCLQHRIQAALGEVLNVCFVYMQGISLGSGVSDTLWVAFHSVVS